MSLQSPCRVLTEVATAVVDDQIEPEELESIIRSASSSSLHASIRHSPGWQSPASISERSRRASESPVLRTSTISPASVRRTASPSYSSPDSSLYSPTTSPVQQIHQKALIQPIPTRSQHHSPSPSRYSPYVVSEAGTTSPISVLSLPDVDDPRLAPSVGSMFGSLPPSPNPHQLYFNAATLSSSEDEDVEERRESGRKLRRRSFLSYADIISAFS